FDRCTAANPGPANRAQTTPRTTDLRSAGIGAVLPICLNSASPDATTRRVSSERNIRLRAAFPPIRAEDWLLRCTIASDDHGALYAFNIRVMLAAPDRSQ